MRIVYHLSNTRNIRRILIFFMIFFFFVQIFPKQEKVEASLKAQSSYELTVEVVNENEVRLEYDIHLVNMSDNFFIRDYSLISNHTDLINLEVKEKGQPVEFRKEHENDKVRIRINLLQRLVSKGEDTNIEIRYNTNQILHKDGIIHILSLPNIKTEEDLIDAKFQISLPDTFQDPSYISLKDKEFKILEGKKVLNYIQQDAPYGILIIFGDSQQYEFIYSYKLENTDIRDKSYTITLPAESSMQSISYTKAYPEPYRTFSDIDGNNIAEYILESGSTQNIRITGFSNYHFNPDEIAKNEWEKYLEETDIWTTNLYEVQQIVSKNTHNDYTTYENALFLYDYIISNFNYIESDAYSKIRVSEIDFSNQQLTCESFSDLYITLLRAYEIPARKVIGYSELEDMIDTIHYWVEFLDKDKNVWITADPCIEARLSYTGFDSLDVQRFILAYHGVSDKEPVVIPPFTKLQDINTDHIVIKSTDYDYSNDETQEVELNYEVGYPDLFFRNIPLKLYITNNSQSIFYLEDLKVNSADVNYMSKHIMNNFNQSVFPGHSDVINLNLTNIKDIFAEKVENYEFEIYAKYGTNELYRQGDFTVNRPFSYMHIISWFISVLFSIIFITLFILLLKKIKRREKKPGIKYKYNFKRSRGRDFLDVPVSLS